MQSPDQATIATTIAEIVSQIASTRLEEPVALSSNTQLIELGVIDSLAVFELVALIEQGFGVSVPHEALLPENFSTPAALAALVASLSRKASTSTHTDPGS